MRASLVLWRSSDKWPLFLLAVIIALSAYTHMWNPAGFPIFHGDESIYVQRGVGILNHEVLYGLHDHPFFGQTVLAGFMHVSGYQDLLDDPPADPSHLEALYAYPRTFMGLLAVLDTLLVYLIADRMFGRRVAAVAAVIFAVAPMSLILRMVMLDSILLPFVLSSVLLALHSRGSGNDGRRHHALLLASGACMGLAIFTKVPAAAMIPPCAILAYWASGRIRDVGLWLAPALAIPAVWPAYAAQAGQLDAWIRDVAWQAGRSNAGIFEAMRRLFEYDPVLIPLGTAGFAFVVICLVLYAGRWRSRGGGDRHGAWGKKGGPVRAGRDGNLKSLGFLAAWFSSILLSFGATGFVLFYQLSMLLPALCVAAAVLILWVAGRGRGGGWLVRCTGSLTGDRTTVIAVLAIGLAGLSTTGVIVHFDAQLPEFEAASFLLRNYSDDPDTVKVVSPISYWLLSDVYGLQNTTRFYHSNDHIHGAFDQTGPATPDAAGPSYRYAQPDAERVILMFDNHDKNFLANIVEGCDYAADSVSMYCHKAYNIMRLHHDGTLIKEFSSETPIGAFPPLPSSIERHLINPSMITEWVPAG